MILLSSPEVTKDSNVLTEAVFCFGPEICSFVRNMQLIGLFIYNFKNHSSTALSLQYFIQNL